MVGGGGGCKVWDVAFMLPIFKQSITRCHFSRLERLNGWYYDSSAIAVLVEILLAKPS